MVEIIHKCAVCKFKNRKMFLMLCAVCPAKVFFSPVSEMLVVKYITYILATILMIIWCSICAVWELGMIFFCSRQVVRLEGGQHGSLAGAGQVKEVSQRIDQCSCYLLHISMFLCIIILLMHYVFVVQFAVCCYFLCPWYTVPSRSQFSTEYFCALPILQSKEPPQEEVSAAFLSPPKCNISDHKKSNIIVGLKRQRRHVLFPKRSCTIAKDWQSDNLSSIILDGIQAALKYVLLWLCWVWYVVYWVRWRWWEVGKIDFYQSYLRSCCV